MERMLKGLAAALLALGVLIVSAYAVSRALPVPQREAEAAARIQARPALAGENGYAALWSLTWDVDVRQAHDLLDEEARRLASTSPHWDGQASEASVLTDVPLLATTDEAAPERCPARESGCLQRVRGNPEGYAAWVAQRKRISDRIEALDAYGHFRTTLPSRIDAPLPGFGPLFDDMTVQAQRFAAGEPDAALRGVCRNASVARKLLGSGDTLLASMVGMALYDASATLFVDMLAELPPDHPVPALCERMFASSPPVTDDLCGTLRGEGRWMAEGFRALSKGAFRGRFADALFLDTDKTLARGAGTYEWYCGESARAGIESDMRLRAPSPPSRLSFSCIANAIGCSLVSIQAPAYADYAWRFQDAAMRQKAVGTWLWLRARAANDTRPLAERLRSRPDAFKSAARDITVEGATLRVPMYERRPGQEDAWRLPVPAWMADAER